MGDILRRIFVLAVLVALIRSSQQQKVNCMKYVFAPVCRGVAAKRSMATLDSYPAQPDQMYPQSVEWEGTGGKWWPYPGRRVSYPRPVPDYE